MQERDRAPVHGAEGKSRGNGRGHAFGEGSHLLSAHSAWIAAASLVSPEADPERGCEGRAPRTQLQGVGT